MQACLNAPEPSSANGDGLDDQVESPEDQSHASVPRGGIPPAPMQGYPGMNAGLTPEQAAMQYGQYIGGRPQAGGQYPMQPGHMAAQPHAQ
jgi:pheromone receptor transcription factor